MSFLLWLFTTKVGLIVVASTAALGWFQINNMKHVSKGRQQVYTESKVEAKKLNEKSQKARTKSNTPNAANELFKYYNYR